MKVTENNQDEVQRRLWSVELEILDEIHRVCTENGLRYSLAYGTLLGAVRHQGFIPWDDDIDIMMPREDYDRLREIWNNKANEGFILEDETMFDDYVNNFAKVRKDHTTFLQFESERNRSFHRGIFVDIFPLDRRAPNYVLKTIQFAAFALCLLFNRGYCSRTGGMIGFGERILLKVVPRKHYRKVSALAAKISQKWNYLSTSEFVSSNTIEDCKILFPADSFERIVTILFCGKRYCVCHNYEIILQRKYGNYMQLPPEDEQVWTHHPILIDFENNIEDLS